MTTYNTGNPIGSTDPRDLYDNAENLDEAANSSADTFQDRTGKSRLTWEGIVKAGTGDAGVIVPVVQQAVQDVVDGVDGQVDVAQNAADRAEAASDAAFINADIYATVAEGHAAVQVGEQFQVLASNGLEYIRYLKNTGTTSIPVGRFPSQAGIDLKANLSQINGLLLAQASDVVVDTTAKTLTLSGRVFQGNRSILLDSSALDFSSLTSANYIICDMSTGDLRSGLGATTLSNNDALIGRIDLPQADLTGFPGGYTRDGVEIGVPSPSGIGGGNAAIFDTASSVIVNTTSRTVTITARVRQGTRQVQLSAEELYYGDLGGRRLIACNMTTGVLTTYVLSATLPVDEAALGLLDTRDGTLIGFQGGYTRNGVVIGEPLPEGAGGASKKYPPIAWNLAGYYDAPEMPGYTTSDSLPLNSIKSAMINGWYDDLLADFPEYITRTHLGDDSTGLPIYEYRFSPPMAWEEVGSVRHARVMIQSGIHPEPMSYVYLYHFMKLVCEDWENSELLEGLRWGVEWSVIPALAPWCIDNRSRTNSNGVNINRNYPEGWTETPEGGNYAGPSPASEPETQYSLAVMDSFSPDIFIDCHNFQSNAHGSFIWMPAADSRFNTTGKAVISVLARKWGAENEWIPDAWGLGRVSVSSSATSQRTGFSKGAISGTFEVCEHFPQEPGQARGSQNTVRYAVSALSNMVIALLRGMS